MNNSSKVRNTNVKNEPSIFSRLTSAATAAANAIIGKNNKNSKNMRALPVTVGINAPTKQNGGMAPLNYRYPANMQQPSEKIMNWATTAGVPTPPESEMRNVAKGGKRRSIKYKSNHSKKNKSYKKTRRNKSTRK